MDSIDHQVDACIWLLFVPNTYTSSTLPKSITATVTDFVKRNLIITMRPAQSIAFLFAFLLSFLPLIALAQGLGDPCTATDETFTGVSEACTSGESSSSQSLISKALR